MDSCCGSLMGESVHQEFDGNVKITAMMMMIEDGQRIFEPRTRCV